MAIIIRHLLIVMLPGGSLAMVGCGAAALVRSIDRGLKPDEVIKILEETAEKSYYLYFPYLEWTQNRINAHDAAQKAIDGKNKPRRRDYVRQ